jgi:hypothetical protein
VILPPLVFPGFELGERPFEGAVIICDAAYQCLDWLIPPFAGQQVVRISQVNLKMFGYNVNPPLQNSNTTPFVTT